MNCELAFDRMLEADPQDLAPESQTELGVHIAGCERCRAVAEEILGGEQVLGNAVRGLEAEDKVNTVVQMVLAAVVLASLGLDLGMNEVVGVLVFLVAATTLASGGAYVVEWTRRAAGVEAAE